MLAGLTVAATAASGAKQAKIRATNKRLRFTVANSRS
jgi:hypothetical protein